MTKKTFIIILSVVLLLAISFFITILFQKNNKDIGLRSELDIISFNNEYLIARNDKSSDVFSYSLYKVLENEKVKKVFNFERESELESRLICWTDTKIYIFDYYPTYYNLDGKHNNVDQRISLLELLNNKPGKLDRVFGEFNESIYYEYSHNEQQYIGKVDLNLENTFELNSFDDLPDKFK